MKRIFLKKDNSSDDFLYVQLYEGIKKQIYGGEIVPGEKLPSVRALSSDTGASVTTVSLAYGQLVAEGYVKGIAGSGYFAESIGEPRTEKQESKCSVSYSGSINRKKSSYTYDPDVFDFVKWKKCASEVYNEEFEKLLFPSPVNGEPELRREIAAYLLNSRGVDTTPESIVIAAGTQQISFHLSRILKLAGISLLAVEKPGYAPVRSVSEDAGFTVLDIPVTENGIAVDKLPVNIASAVYVNPSSQFPTGVVMPVSARHRLLDWAKGSSSFVIEDDYNSELRYSGKPLPSLKSLDTDDVVIYLGSFSTTLFEAIKIAYMVLPEKLARIFNETSESYTQTCSKAEQLTLARFMQKGFYYTAIKKKRALFARKLDAVNTALARFASSKVSLSDTKTGLSVVIDINSSLSHDELTESANSLGIRVEFIPELSSPSDSFFLLYYAYLPLSEIEGKIGELLKVW